MKIHLRKAQASLIIGLILVGTILSVVPSGSAEKFLTFEAVLEARYDADAVTDAIFQPDGAPVNIPIYLKFKVEVPPAFMAMPLRLIFLQTFIITSAAVKITILNPPTWAAVSINPSPAYINIDTVFQETEAVLTIAAHDDAPAEGFVLKLKAETDYLLNKHVGPKEAFCDITFQPGYIPLIDVYTDNPTRIVGPQETVVFPIKITNLGNKRTLVTGRIINYPEGWSAQLSQSQITIPSAAEGNNVGMISLSIIPPYGFGWHNDLEDIYLDFTPEFSPPSSNNSAYTGTPVPVQLTVRSRGFSTPGFETAGMLLSIGIAIALISIIYKRKHI
jgi:hypothetical protein